MSEFVFFVKDGDVLLGARSLTEYEIWTGAGWETYRGDRAKVRLEAWMGREIAEETIVRLGGTVEDLAKE